MAFVLPRSCYRSESGFFARIPGSADRNLDGGLQVVEVDLSLAEPLFERLKSGIGEQFGHAGHSQLGACVAGAAETDGVVAKRTLEVLTQAGDEAVNQCGELMAGRFGQVGRGAVEFEVTGEVVVRDGTVGRIGQLFEKRQRAPLLGNGLGYVALSAEQVGQ